MFRKYSYAVFILKKDVKALLSNIRSCIIWRKKALKLDMCS